MILIEDNSCVLIDQFMKILPSFNHRPVIGYIFILDLGDKVITQHLRPVNAVDHFCPMGQIRFLISHAFGNNLNLLIVMPVVIILLQYLQIQQRHHFEILSQIRPLQEFIQPLIISALQQSIVVHTQNLVFSFTSAQSDQMHQLQNASAVLGRHKVYIPEQNCFKQLLEGLLFVLVLSMFHPILFETRFALAVKFLLIVL